MALDVKAIDRFVTDGFVRVEQAFPGETAAAARAILWRDTGSDPNNPATWTRPVVRLGYYHDPPFREAVNTPVLHEAFDRLVGRGRWQPRMNLGTFPVRFPSADDPGDTGWHVDTSFQGDAAPTDYFNWRVNITSRGRALLMLFLFSDIGPDDAPTRLRIGSHLAIARRLAPHGERGLSLNELAANGFAESADCAVLSATGDAGTVYLCHPFLVHAAQPHRSTRPRFLAQPALLPFGELQIDRVDGDYSPVEQAVRIALGR